MRSLGKEAKACVFVGECSSAKRLLGRKGGGKKLQLEDEGC